AMIKTHSRPRQVTELSTYMRMSNALGIVAQFSGKCLRQLGKFWYHGPLIHCWRQLACSRIENHNHFRATSELQFDIVDEKRNEQLTETRKQRQFALGLLQFSLMAPLHCVSK